MDTMKLEPLSGSIILASNDILTGRQWCKIIGNLFERIATRCNRTSSDTIIGHIKGISFFNETKFMKVSLFSEAHPAEIDFSNGIETSEVKFLINVIVYGLSDYILENLLREELLNLQNQAKVTIRIEQLSTLKHQNKIFQKMPDDGVI